MCDGIREEACRETPGNFVLLLVSYFLTKLGDAIASPKTTLARVTTVVGAPAYGVGFLVPIRESGSLVPQLVIVAVILLVGSVGALAPLISNAGVIALLVSMGRAGAVLGTTLSEVEG